MRIESFPAQTHAHAFTEEGDHLVCACGLRRLRFVERGGVRVGVRSNGRPWTQKDNQNRFLTPDEYIALVERLTSRAKHSVRFLINTGARVREAQNVRVGDVNFKEKRLTLRVTKTKAKKGEVRGKQRTIPISTAFAGFLLEHARGKKLVNKSGAVLDNATFGLLSTSGLNMALKSAGSSAGILHPEDLSAHTLRKTLEVWLMSLGVNDIALLAHFGHDLKTAASHYVSPDVFSWDEKDKMRRIIGDLYGR